MARIIAPVAALVAALFPGFIWRIVGDGEDTGFAQWSATEPGPICFGYTLCPDVRRLGGAAMAGACLVENI